MVLCLNAFERFGLTLTQYINPNSIFSVHQFLCFYWIPELEILSRYGWGWRAFFDVVIFWSGTVFMKYRSKYETLYWEEKFLTSRKLLGKKCRCLGSLFWRRSCSVSIWTRYVLLYYQVLSSAYVSMVSLSMSVLSSSTKSVLLSSMLGSCCP